MEVPSWENQPSISLEVWHRCSLDIDLKIWCSDFWYLFPLLNYEVNNVKNWQFPTLLTSYFSNGDRYQKSLHQIYSQQSKEQLYQTSKLNTLWFSQEGTSKSKKVTAILKFHFACNYTVNLNFDARYLENGMSDLHNFFTYFFIFRSSVTYKKFSKKVVYPPLALIIDFKEQIQYSRETLMPLCQNTADLNEIYLFERTTHPNNYSIPP